MIFAIIIRAVDPDFYTRRLSNKHTPSRPTPAILLIERNYFGGRSENMGPQGKLFTFAYPAEGIMERCAHDRVSVLMSNVEIDVIAMVTHTLLFAPRLFPKFYERLSVQGIRFVKSHRRSRMLKPDSTELANLLVSPNKQRSRAKFY